ncbi:hypothetical protein DM47_3046 [Burkholderia mallei]|nr:hypothetical protein DM49_3621 [Burkholderia mallei]KOT02022.1 hypothetical protein DM50_3690 [Burkholderia mallei]KOT16161.1 hypothetical protein DM47_3046 [Burkholderia mallei]
MPAGDLPVRRALASGSTMSIELPTWHGAGGMSSGASFDISMDVSISLSTDVPPSGGRPRASVGAGVDRRYRCEPSPRRWSRPLRRIARAAVVLRLPKQFVQLLPNIGAACGARSFVVERGRRILRERCDEAARKAGSRESEARRAASGAALTLRTRRGDALRCCDARGGRKRRQEVEAGSGAARVVDLRGEATRGA